MNKLQKLLKKYQKGTASAEESAFVEKYYDYFEKEEDFAATVSAVEKQRMEQDNWQRLSESITRETPARVISMTHRWRWVAASVIILLVAGGYFWISNRNAPASQQASTTWTDIAPGRNGAVLTLGNGAQMVLDSARKGIIATQNGSPVILKDNSVAYGQAVSPDASIVYNTLSTPRGRQYHLELPDGTGVWLNAASSIHYPTSFTGKQRSVRVDGEVYFEVAKDKTKPFIVDIAGKARVEVLGTHFNINAYTDEAYMKTTLLEGSIKLISRLPAQTGPAVNGQVAILKPGQQAKLKNNTIQVMNEADPGMAVAWKDGSFQFNRTPIDEILRQLSRWYDINIVYEEKVPQLSFTGVLRRDYSLVQTLTILETLGIHFRIEGKIKLIVMP